MSANVVFQDLHTQIPAKIGRHLQGLGFIPATISGEKIPEQEWGMQDCGIGVLFDDPTFPRQKIFGLIPLSRRLAFPATIWFSSVARRSVTKDTWLIEVKGERYVEEMKRLGREIAERFEVTCIVRLIDSELHGEIRACDFSS